MSPKRSAVVTTFNVGQLVLLHVVHTKLQNLSRPCDDFKLVVLIVVHEPAAAESSSAWWSTIVCLRRAERSQLNGFGRVTNSSSHIQP